MKSREPRRVMCPSMQMHLPSGYDSHSHGKSLSMAMLNNQRVYSAIGTYQPWIDDDTCKCWEHCATIIAY